MISEVERAEIRLKQGMLYWSLQPIKQLICFYN